MLAKETFPAHHRHGLASLHSLLDQSPETLSRLTGNGTFSQIDFRRFAFIDTETTGLAGGTGTYVFLVGIGYFADESFHLWQFFMRDYDEEAAMLQYLGEAIQRFSGIVSFNGRTFDVPLLENRFSLARLRSPILDLSHLDLLLPARHLWRARLTSCALSSLEREILGVRRDQRDIPGFLIPNIYFDYVRTRDVREISRVFYHNAQDILSLVILASQICSLAQAPERGLTMEAVDLLSLGRLYERMGLSVETEQAYRHALRHPSDPEIKATICYHLSFLYKRTGRWEQAIELWRAMKDSGWGGVLPYVELAKYYEHRSGDHHYALALTYQAREIAAQKSCPTLRARELNELDHRIRRLERKLARRR